ncbi:MAG: Tab2/Atab2 family RNA-binding protein [Leptolyngbyaceae cyanobacterium]
MAIWEADCYRRPLKSEAGHPLWELLICDTAFQFTYGVTTPQADVNSTWIQQQLETALHKAAEEPTVIRVFRPQALSLIQTAAQALNLDVQATRYTPALKQWLVQRSRWYPSQPNFSAEPYEPVALDQPAPIPLPESLQGEQWRFGSVSAQDFQASLINEPIPIQSVPKDWLPLQAGLASDAAIPGVIIDAGRQAMALCQWLQEQQPAAIAYIPGAPDGILLEAGLVERWVLLTFEDESVKSAARTFTERKIRAQGLHFLLVRPDDSGMTFTGLWLLRQ